MRAHLPALFLTLGLAFAAGPALADVAFRSPSGNIHCSLYDWDGTTTVRCDLRDYTPSNLPAPANCDYDWGMAFEVGERGRGYLACVSDTMLDPGNPVLDYGKAVSIGGISCVSAETGMTCTNAQGHGFSIARARQRLF